MVQNEKVISNKVFLGLKHICVSCSTRFYDLGVYPPVCPKCKEVQPIPVKSSDLALENGVKLVEHLEEDEILLDDVDVHEPLEDASELESEDDTLDSDINLEIEEDRDN